MPRCRLRWFVVPAVLTALGTATPQASTVMQLNLGEMVQRADRIYRGTVLSISADTVAAGGGQLPVSVYRLRVDETFRGEFPEVKGLRLAEIRTLGKLSPIRSGRVRSAVALPRMPDLAVGGSYLVLTTRPSAIGLSTTVGLGQGCFSISRVGKDEEAVNEAHNVGLFRGMTAPAAPAARRAVQSLPSVPDGKPVRYADLADRIRGLVAR